VPGPWDVAVDGCGETFRVTGKLLDERGEEVGTAGEASVTTRLVDAALGELAEGAALVARCGEGARGSLTQLIPPEACSASRISWEYVNGPALAATTLSGRTVDMATRETGLDQLVGQRVRVRVTADAGGGNVVRREHEVPITAEPFVEVTHETEKPAGSESGLLGVSVALRNRTACGVSEVVFEERLEGMAYVAGTARLDGQHVDVEQEGDVLRVRGLTLSGDAVRRFTYVARPTLLGTPRMEARAFMGPVPITRDTRSVPPEAGCGCSSGSSGATAFGLAALAMRVLRRRRRAS
jgi:MYXO-CTERM domain-containing protein